MWNGSKSWQYVTVSPCTEEMQHHQAVQRLEEDNSLTGIAYSWPGGGGGEGGGGGGGSSSSSGGSGGKDRKESDDRLSLRNRPSIFLEGLRKTIKSLS